MIWVTAPRTERSAYLLFEPHPAMNNPTISSVEMARKNRMPVSRSATPMPGAKGIVAKISRHGMRNTTGARVKTGRSAAAGMTCSLSDSLTPPAPGSRRHDLLLEQQLDAVGDRLQQPVRADAIRTDPRLHARGELALEQR